MTECNCSLRIKLVGDGCSICNPDYYAEILQEQNDEIRGDYREDLGNYLIYFPIELHESSISGFWSVIAEYFTHE